MIPLALLVTLGVDQVSKPRSVQLHQRSIRDPVQHSILELDEGPISNRTLLRLLKQLNVQQPLRGSGFPVNPK